jgi:hypothetical protein
MATYFMGGQSNLAGIILGGKIKANRFINNTIASRESLGGGRRRLFAAKEWTRPDW